MFPLSSFYEKGMNTTTQQQLVNTDFSNLNQNTFKLAVPSIQAMDEHSIAILVKNNIDEIAKDIISGNISYINLFTNQKFILGFIRGISSIPISYEVRLACNKLTYDYFTSENPDDRIKQQYLNISRIVNRTETAKLMAIGLDDNTASNLALCRYSSDNERTNIKRLNFTIYHKDPNVMTEQMVVWIYEKLFTRISPLFYAVMFEVYTPQEELDFGDNFMEVFGTVSLAALDILNNMTSENIKKVLIGYIEEWEYRNRPPVRFSLRSLSGDYSRIARMVEFITSTGKFVP